mgnify:CR=1 FL=1|jgi:hypothetical protein
MNQSINCIDPSTTDYVLKHLSLAIDEIKLVRSINSINEQIAIGEAAQLEQERRPYLLSELRFLIKRLQVVRERAALV